MAAEGRGPIDTLTKRWLRRSISLSLLFCATAAALLLSPGLIGAALVVDGFRRRLSACRAVAFFLLFLCCETVGIVICFCLWLLKPLLTTPSFLHANLRLQFGWAEVLRRSGFWLFGIRAQVEGADLLAQGPYLLFMRHTSMADTMLPIMLAGAAHGIALRWVMKRELLWDPCLDVVGNRLPNCFVSRDPAFRSRDLAAIEKLGRELDFNEGVVLWPEGTRFSRKKRQRIIDKLSRSGSADELATAKALQHVLPIRLGGALTLLNVAPDCDLVFCAHHGLERAVSFADLWNGSVVGSQLRIHCFRIAAEAVPRQADAQAQFLREQWQRVDRWVAQVSEREQKMARNKSAQ